MNKNNVISKIMQMMAFKKFKKNIKLVNDYYHNNFELHGDKIYYITTKFESELDNKRGILYYNHRNQFDAITYYDNQWEYAPWRSIFCIYNEYKSCVGLIPKVYLEDLLLYTYHKYLSKKEKDEIITKYLENYCDDCRYFRYDYSE